VRGPTFAKRRDANEADLRTDMLGLQVVSWPMDQPVDLMCWSIEHDKLFLVEIKNPDNRHKEKRTDVQIKFFLAAEELGLPVFLIETREDIVECLKTLR